MKRKRKKSLKIYDVEKMNFNLVRVFEKFMNILKTLKKVNRTKVFINKIYQKTILGEN